MTKTRIKVLELNDGTKQYYPQYKTKIEPDEWRGELIVVGFVFLPIAMIYLLCQLFRWQSTHDLLKHNGQMCHENWRIITSKIHYDNIDHAKMSVDLAIVELKQKEDDKIAKKQKRIAEKVKKKTIVKYP